MSNIKSTILSIITLIIVLVIVNYAYINVTNGATKYNDNNENSNNTLDTKLVNTDNLYILKTTIKEINDKSDIVTVITDNGNMYQFYGIEDWQINDKCLLIMDSKEVNNAKDDVIIKEIYTD